MAFPNAVASTSNDNEYDAKAHADYDIHRQRAHKQKTGHGKTHKEKIKAARVERATRTAPKPSTTARHTRRKSAVLEDEDSDYLEDNVESDGDDASDDQHQSESSRVGNAMFLSELVVSQTTRQGWLSCRTIIFHETHSAGSTDFLHVSDFYLALPSLPPSPNLPIPQSLPDDDDSLLGPTMGFGNPGTWMPSKRDSNSSTMHMRTSSRGSSGGYELETTVHVMDSKW